jgi:hypothetical protein
LIRYEDDLEHITLQQLQALLTDKQAIHNKLKEYFDNTDADNDGFETFDDDAAAISQKSSQEEQEDSLPCSQ